MASLTKRATAGTPTSSRSVSLAKRKKYTHQTSKEGAKVSLDRVLGMTCYSCNSLSISESSVAYPAGCVAVLLKKNKQFHIRNKKTISCLCFSPHGSYLATGESGHEPCVRVWDCSTLTQLVQLKGHTFGVGCVVFSPNSKHLVSIGYQHDRQVIVWNWKNGTRIVHGKFANTVNAVTFSHDRTNRLGSSYFVTAHHRRVQFWYYDVGKDTKNPTVLLKSRSAVLGDLQDNNFVAVCCGSSQLSKNVYTLTRSGRLCLFDEKRQLDRFTEVKTTTACSLALNNQYLFCGCSDGVIRIFDPYTLDYISTMPRPHALGIDVAAPTELKTRDDEKYPDTLAIAVHGNKVTVVYNDHSLYTWDLSNIRQIGKTHSYLYHSACVWDICTYPSLEDGDHPLLPDSCFVTCSSDNTIRFWCLSDSEGVWPIKNMYSKELIRVIYLNPSDVSCLKDPSTIPGDASAVADSTRGVRCIDICPTGQHIALGDRLGNIRVHDLQFMDKIYEEVAHDSEILSVAYSPKFKDTQFLATASRDRMIHIFTAQGKEYQPIQSIPDHSASVTTVKFKATKDGMQLLSSGADKSIIFHTMEKMSDEPMFQRSNHIVGKATIYDMDLDVLGKHLVTAGQDKNLRLYQVSSGKQRSIIKAPTSDDGSLIKVSLDRSGLYAAASSAEKTVLLFDIYSGECIAKLSGHSEVVTQVVFSHDCKYLYTVSGDSCIFVWRLSKEITQAMYDRLTEMGRPIPPSVPTPVKLRETYSVTPSTNVDQPDNSEEQLPDFEFRLSQLPAWAQKQVLSRPSMAVKVNLKQSDTSSNKPPLSVKGKWAERAAEEGKIKFASEEHDSDTSMNSETLKDVPEQLTGEQEDSEVDFTLQEADSDTEIANLTATLTKESEEQSQEEETDRVSTPEESPEESDQEEVIYPTSSNEDMALDPSLFSVTTPTKRRRPSSADDCGEDDGDTASSQSSEDSPPTADKGFALQETLFVKTNFESLEKVEDFFHSTHLQVPTHDPRLSISARYFEKALQKSLGGKTSSAQSLEAAGIIVRVQDANGQRTSATNDNVEGDTDSPSTNGAKEELIVEDIEKEPDICTSPSELDSLHDKNQMESDKSTDNVEDSIDRQASSDVCLDGGQAKLSKRRESFEEAVDKTKKRLEELGYSLPQKDSLTSKLKQTTQESQSGDDSSNSHEIEEPIKEPKPTQATCRKVPRLKLRSVTKPTDSVEVSTKREETQTERNDSEVDQESKEESKTDSVVQDVHTDSELVPEEEDTDMKNSETATTETLSDRAIRLLEALESSYKELVDTHDEVLDNLKSQGESPHTESQNEETLSIIATGVTSLKSKLVTMTNKNRKLWRGKTTSTTNTTTTDSSPNVTAVSGGYNLRSTPTRIRQQLHVVETTDSGISLDQSSPFATTPRHGRDVSSLAQVVQRREVKEGEKGQGDYENELKSSTTTTTTTEQVKSESNSGSTATIDHTATESELQLDSESTCTGTGRLLGHTVTLPVGDVMQARELAEQLMSIIGNFYPEQTSSLPPSTDKDPA